MVPRTTHGMVGVARKLWCFTLHYGPSILGA